MKDVAYDKAEEADYPHFGLVRWLCFLAIKSRILHFDVPLFHENVGRLCDEGRAAVDQKHYDS